MNKIDEEEMFVQQVMLDLKEYYPDCRYERVELEKFPIFVVAFPKKISRSFFAYAQSNDDSFIKVGEIGLSKTIARGFISMFETHIDYQGCGIGRTLMNCAKACYAHQNINNINLHVAPTNDMLDRETGEVLGYEQQYSALINTYRHLGFELHGYEQTQLPPISNGQCILPRHDLIEMSCIINPEQVVSNSPFSRSFYLMTPNNPCEGD